MTGPDPYQGYPQYQSGGYGPPGIPPRPQPPQPVMYAFYAMVAGAVVQAISIALPFLQLDSLRDEVRRSVLDSDPSATEDTIDGLVAASLVFVVVLGLIAVGLWLLMAFMNRAGRNWARITATVFFALNTLNALVTLAVTASDAAGANSITAGSSTVSGTIVTVLLWLIGLAAIILVWNPQASRYFTGRRGYGPGTGYPPYG